MPLEQRFETPAPPLAITLAGEDLPSGAETWTELPRLGETAFSDGGLRQGTDYLHARFRSPLTGRFLSVDPAGPILDLPQSWNRYSYVLGSPLQLVDPAGRSVVLDSPGDLAALGSALEDEELAGQLAVEEKKIPVKLFGWTLWTRTEYHVSNGGADWSESANPNARLLDSAIDSTTRIQFGLTGASTYELRHSNGALTDTTQFSSENRLRITLNPSLVAAARVPGSRGQPIGVELGWAIMHEFGHALGHFGYGVYGGPMARVVGGNTDTYALDAENQARKWSASARGIAVPLRQRHDW